MAGKSAKEQLGVDLPDPEPLEAPEPVEAETENGRPDWLPGNFKDEHEFASAYKSAQDKIREQGEAQKNLESQLSQLTSLVENIQPGNFQQQQVPSNANEQLMAAYENDPIGTVVFLASQASQQQFHQLQQQQQPQFQQQQQLQGELIANTAERVMEAKFEDWGDYGKRVGDLIDKNPNLLPNDVLLSLERTTDTLEAIYKQVKYDDLVYQIENGTAADHTRMKQQAQSISGNVGKPGQASELDDKMARLTAAAKNSSWASFRSG